MFGNCFSSEPAPLAELPAFPMGCCVGLVRCANTEGLRREKDGGVCFPLVSNFLRTSHPYYTVETFKHNPPTYAGSILLQEYPASCLFDTAYWEQEPPASPSGEAALASPRCGRLCPQHRPWHRGVIPAQRDVAPGRQRSFRPAPRPAVLGDRLSVPLAVLRAPLTSLKLTLISTPLFNY